MSAEADATATVLGEEVGPVPGPAAEGGPGAAGAPEAPRSRRRRGPGWWRAWCRGTRIVVALAALWIVFAAARPVLSGRLAWWALLDLVPPFFLLAVPLLFPLAIPAVRIFRVRLPASARWTLVALTVLGLGLGFPQSGLNLAALGSPPPAAPADALRITVWDTVGWDTGKNADAFYRYLTSQHSDIYILQEYIGIGPGGAPYPIDDTARLRAAFPGYSFTSVGELLVLSRYPILDRATIGDALRPAAVTDTVWSYGTTRILRVDLDVAGRTLSVYDVHLPDLFNFGPSVFGPSFYEQASEMAGWRDAEMGALQADIARNPNQVVVGGDLNLVPGSSALGKLGALQDAAHASRSLYPVSFWVGVFQAYRMDWTFASPDLRLYSYDLLSPQGLSTHRAQDLALTLPGA
jgi:endonuclease/exonuclease/phosphatase (EEP) superfamily protein YafD